jgi:hypothetical protein
VQIKKLQKLKTLEALCLLVENTGVTRLLQIISLTANEGSILKVVCELEKDRINYLEVRGLFIFCIAQKTNQKTLG